MIFPTRVGVFLPLQQVHQVARNFPHASGGVSSKHHQHFYYVRFSPREWGCFYILASSSLPGFIFPTRVGVFLERHYCGMSDCNFPHASGGVSIKRYIHQRMGLFSPREWGCFSFKRGGEAVNQIFPTRVGVFLK